MKDGVEHKLYNEINSKKRTDVTAALAAFSDINKALEELGIIKKPESLRNSVTNVAFDKLKLIENTLGKAKVANKLKKLLVVEKSKADKAVDYYNEGRKELASKNNQKSMEEDIEELIQ